MKAKQYSFIAFNLKGNLRGFGSGFSRNQMKSIMMEESGNGNLVLLVKNLLDVPRHFIEGFYYKTSDNDDLAQYRKHLNGQSEWWFKDALGQKECKPLFTVDLADENGDIPQGVVDFYEGRLYKKPGTTTIKPGVWYPIKKKDEKP